MVKEFANITKESGQGNIKTDLRVVGSRDIVRTILSYYPHLPLLESCSGQINKLTHHLSVFEDSLFSIIVLPKMVLSSS